MPLTIVPDSIVEFERAYAARYREGQVLATSGELSGAIYLWGYVVEMILKAAYFKSCCKSPTDPIANADFQMARNNASNYGITCLNLHDLNFWAELLVAHHVAIAIPYVPVFGQAIAIHAAEMKQQWDVVMRYHRTAPSNSDYQAARYAVAWFVYNRAQM